METNVKKNQLEENRLDDLLSKIINGDFTEWESLNRLEQYLVCILTRKDLEALGKPMNRLEVLLQALYTVVPENSVEILAARIEEQ
jgi:hypothetical protein